MNLNKQRIGFIGAGAMAEALLQGFLKAGLVTKENLYVTDINEERIEYLCNKLGINSSKDNVELAKRVDVVFLAVKPKVISKVLREIGTAIKNKQLVVSIAAGVTTEALEQAFLNSISVIRVMPNTPSLVGEGASAYTLGQFATESQGQLVGALLGAVGKAVQVTEDLIDSVTGISGSGPAYVYMIIEALADGGVKMGLPRDIAYTLAAQTLLGAAKMVLDTGEHPAKLKDMVTTPGGTTIAGLHALEKGNLRATIINAVEAATQRAGEMAK